MTFANAVVRGALMVVSHALMLSAVGCGSAGNGSPQSDTSDNAISGVEYHLSGTYRSSVMTPTTRFSEMTFAHSARKFSAVKANCTASCNIEGTYALADEGKRLRLRHDGIVETIAFAADSKATRVVKKPATSQSGVLQKQTLQPKGIAVDLSLGLQCGDIRSAPVGEEASATDCNASGREGTDGGGSGGSLVSGGPVSLVCKVAALIVEAFFVADAPSQDGTSPLNLRPLSDWEDDTPHTQMTQQEAPAPRCALLLEGPPAQYSVEWPEASICRRSVRDVGSCTSDGTWVPSGAPTCAAGAFVAEGIAGQSCSEICGRYVDSAGCRAEAEPASANPKAKATAEEIVVGEGTRCASKHVGCFCCESDADPGE